MFILVFIVMFGPKKGSIVAYRSNWISLIQRQFFIFEYYILRKCSRWKFSNKFLIHKEKYWEQVKAEERRVPQYPFYDPTYRFWGRRGSGYLNLFEFGERVYVYMMSKYIYNKRYCRGSHKNCLNRLRATSTFRFQFTAVTSRTTSYLLFFFWVFFFFFGESLLLLTFNYMSLVDSITSHSFFIVKQHIIFLTKSLSQNLSNSINFYIYFLTLSSFLYLINLNFIFNYNFFTSALRITLAPLFILLIWCFF